MRTRLLSFSLLAALAAALVPALPAAAASTDIVINEVESNGDVNDWVELYNTGSAAVDVSGWVLKDSTENDSYTIPASTSIAAGAFLTIDVSGVYFGLGGADSARLYEGATLVASYSWAAHAAITYGRCPDGVGAFGPTVASTKGAANACELDPADVVRINEVESDGGSPGDWIELVNTGTSAVDASGLMLRDSTENDAYTVAAGTSIPAGGYLVADVGGAFFGLGGADSARLFSGATLVDSYSWTSHAATSYGRCPDGVGSFATTVASTKGAANDCVPQAVPSVIVNEVESSGGTPGDWAELLNTGATPVDVSGWIFRDSEQSHQVALPAGTVIAPAGFFVIEEAFFGNGLGSADSARLFLADGVTLVDSRSWTSHATTTYGICGTDFVTTTSPTKGAANDCSSPVRINEVESDAGTPGDWIELKNTGATAVDLTGYVLKDSTENDSYAIAPGTSIPAGGYLVADVGGAFFGLGGADSARLFSGTTLVDSYSWTTHAATSYGRCPDGTGDFAATTASTKGAVNACVGDLVTSPWPGGASVATADDAGVFGGDLSGLAFDGDVVWAVRNGDGTLFRLVRDGANWTPDTANGWSNGKPVHYADGTGTPDSEGVAVTSAGAAGGVFVSSERNGAANSVSRLAVLRYDVSGTGAELTATREWNLTGVLPAVGANLGLEGIAWVPDGYLVDGGFLDERTGQAYDPADYAGHGTGLFFVGVEANGAVYAFALDQGSGAAHLIATIDSGLEIVADLEFDAERGALWVACDDTCSGRTATFEIGGDGRFAPVSYFERPASMPNINNEGFTIAPQAQCESGVKEVLWSDDANTGGHALRSGTISCTEADGPIPFPAEGLIDANRGPVTVPATAAPGETISVGVGGGLAGESIDGWIYSEPVHLGTVVVTAGGTVSLTIPASTVLGDHRIAIVDAEGNLVGWDDIRIAAGSAAGLASTGVELTGPVTAALLLLLAGAAIALVRTRRA